MTAKARRWKKLDEKEQSLFELFIAGWINRAVYEERWREIDRQFRALGNVPIAEFAR